MAAGMFVLGFGSGLLTAYALDQMIDTAPGGTAPPGTSGGVPPTQGTPEQLEQMKQEFLPRTAEVIHSVKRSTPGAADSWQKMAAQMPGLTEAVSLYYVMADREVPMGPKLSIAGALAYTLFPQDSIPDYVPGLGQLDDLGVILVAFRQLAEHIDHRHLNAAKEWLTSQGVEPKPFMNLGIAPDQVNPFEKVLPGPSQHTEPKVIDADDAQPPAAPPSWE